MKQYLRWKKLLFVLIFCLAGSIGLSQNMLVSKAANTITLGKCQSAGTTVILVPAEISCTENGTYELYRATKNPASGGKYTLLDSFEAYGASWGNEGNGWHRSGQKRAVEVYSFEQSPTFNGSVVFQDAKARLGRTYYYQLVFRSYDNGETVSSNMVSGKTAIGTPEIVKCCSASNTSVKVAWTRVDKASGYIVYRKNGKKWTKVATIKKGSTVTWTNKKLKSGKTYEYRVRAYCKTGGKTYYSSYSPTSKASLKKLTVKGSYKKGSVYGPSLSTGKLTEVRRVVQGFKDNYIRKGMSDYEKVWAAFCFIRANSGYARRGWQYNGANTAWGALVYGEAQCSGFARGMKALCDAIGIDCRYVHADSKASNPSHQWNQVKIGGKWYIIDAQGGFFLVGTDTWRNMMRMSWSTKGLPKCSKKDHSRGGFTYSIT